MNLYNISEETVSAIIRKRMNAYGFEDGRLEIIEKTAHKSGLPLKIVFSVEGNDVTVITAFPLKKGLKK